MKNILVPISFSEASKNALVNANTIAKQNGATIALLHCYPSLEYNREYNFGKLSYSEGIRQMLADFYIEHIESTEKQPVRILVFEGSVSMAISEISDNYELLVLSKKKTSLSKSNMWFGDKLFYVTTISLCPVLLLPSKRDEFAFSELKNIWHVQRKDIEADLIKPQLVDLKIDLKSVKSKSLQQVNFTSALWRSIVNYTKTRDDTELSKIQDLFSDEHLDLLIIVNHRTGLFEKFLKDNTFKIFNQFDIPVLVLQAKSK